MTISYTGSRQTKNLRNELSGIRLAEISYNENESVLMDRMAKLLEVKGWKVDNSVDGWASVEVIDREEYAELVTDYKEVKRCIKNCMRFGF